MTQKPTINEIEKNPNLFFEALENQKQLLLAGMTKLNYKIEVIQKELSSIKNSEPGSPEPLPKSHSDDLKELAIALAKAQGEIEIAGKVSSGYNFKYADLTEIIKVSRPALSKNGLSVLQPIVSNRSNGKIYLETVLLHISGQWMKSTLEVPEIEISGKTPVQSFGATVTYLRRYSYASLVGVVASKEEDLEK